MRPMQCTHQPTGEQMNAKSMLEEIREANLTYLVLAQNMIRDDKPQAMYRLGVSEDVATMIETLTPAQLVKVAATSQLVCRFACNDEMVWGLLTSHTKDRELSGVHVAILRAAEFAEAA
jgi:flagellar transcriptional activator FlhD